MNSLHFSTLFWIIVAACLVVAELAITLLLVRLSARPMRNSGG